VLSADAAGTADSAGTGTAARRSSPVAQRDAARNIARYRSQVLAWSVGAGLAVLGGRTAWLMLVPDERLEDKVASLYHDLVRLEARRGTLLDRDGQVLATSVEMPTLRANPSLIPAEEAPALAQALADLIGDSPERLLERLRRTQAQDVVIAEGLSPDLAQRARALASGGKLFLREEGRRYLPEGMLAGSLLGVVGDNGAGGEGLELSLDETLRGDTLQVLRLRDRKGRGLQATAVAMQTEHRGDDIVLTLDRTVQFAAEQAIDGVMERSKPFAANMVVLDVRTGEILALANRNTPDPEDKSGFPYWLRNRAVADQLEPGSVFKPFIVALALEAGVVTPETKVDCEGGTWHIGRSRIRDDHPHGVVMLYEVVKYSSNIGAAKLALRTGAERIIGGLSDFGFGRDPGTQMRSVEPGFLRPAASIKPIELATTAYGQGVTATTLQLAAAVATIGNGGVRMQPHVVREVRSPQGEVVQRVEPEVDRRVISEEVAHQVARMMVTVTEKGGTGTRAAIEGYEVAGKTGTAWKVVDGRYSASARISSFIGFVPADDPRVAIAVVVDTPTEGSRYGGIAAAPAFHDVAEVAMRRFGVPPAPPAPPAAPEGLAVAPAEPVPVLEPEPEPPASAASWSVGSLDERGIGLAWAEGDGLRVPDLSGLGLRDVLVLFQDSGLELSLKGHGRAVAQTPEAGGTLLPGGKVEVSFQ
jgi:cell division protein FtsI (penicillin-binding protein 3)